MDFLFYIFALMGSNLFYDIFELHSHEIHIKYAYLILKLQFEAFEYVYTVYYVGYRGSIRNVFSYAFSLKDGEKCVICEEMSFGVHRIK